MTLTTTEQPEMNQHVGPATATEDYTTKRTIGSPAAKEYQTEDQTIQVAGTQQRDFKTPHMTTATAATATAATAASPTPVFIPGTLGRRPCIIECPNCKESASTKVKTYPGWVTWGMVGGVAIIFWPLCWVPLCVDSMKTTEHYCPWCGKKVGTSQPFSECCTDVTV